MISSWQDCQGNYKPQDVFKRGNCTIITKDIREVEEGLWKWQEYAVSTNEYEIIVASISPLSRQIEQNCADIDYIATMSDIEL